MTTLTRPAEVEQIAQGWFRHWLLFGNIVTPDKMGRIHQYALDGVGVKDETRDGWTWLTLYDNGRTVARARWRYDDSLAVIWEPLS